MSEGRTRVFGLEWRWHEMTKAQVMSAIVIAGALIFTGPAADGQGTLARKAITKVAPVYPEVARESNITGKVRVAVVVARNGSIKDSKVLGGHPLLVNAAMAALQKWKFEPADEETAGTVEFNFGPH